MMPTFERLRSVCSIAPHKSLDLHCPQYPAHRRRSVARVALCATLLLSLTACKKELYGQLTERDSNNIVAALVEDGVEADKSTPDSGKTWVVSVDQSDLVRATQILQSRGIPEKQYDDLGALFKKDGLVSTPTEERVRFIYGLSQELDDTLSKIDGVVDARVQIVLPNNDPLAENAKPSSAAVFIKYRADADLETLTPAIKNLVVHSIEGLTYDQVSVTSVRADPLRLRAEPASRDGSLIFAAMGFLVFLLGAAALFLLFRERAITLTRELFRLRGDKAGPAGSSGSSGSGPDEAAKASM